MVEASDGDASLRAIGVSVVMMGAVVVCADRSAGKVYRKLLSLGDGFGFRYGDDSRRG